MGIPKQVIELMETIEFKQLSSELDEIILSHVIWNKADKGMQKFSFVRGI